jgi:hypothetical protein
MRHDKVGIPAKPCGVRATAKIHRGSHAVGLSKSRWLQVCAGLSRRQMETLCRGPGLGIRFKYLEYWDAASDAELPIWLGRFAAQQETWKAVDVNSLVPSSAKDTVSSRAERNLSKRPKNAPMVDSPVTFSKSSLRYSGILQRDSRNSRPVRRRMMQSAANHSPRSSSLLNRELTGNFGVFGLKMSPGEVEKSRFYKGFVRKFPTQRNRE